MSKFFIHLTILLLFSCKDNPTGPEFSGSKRTISDYFYLLTNHPIAIEKENLRLTLALHLNQEKVVLEDYLKNQLISDKKIENIIEKKKENESFQLELDSILNLGGLKIEKNGTTLLNYGDWKGLYTEEPNSKKLKKTALIQKIKTKDDYEIIFFIRNKKGIFPVDFSYLGYESRFYLYQGDSTLRYAKDEFVDFSKNQTHFRDHFLLIQETNPNAEILKFEDFTLYFISGKTPIFYFVFLFIKIVIIVVFLIFSIFGFIHWKKYNTQIQKENLDRKEQFEKAKEILEDDFVLPSSLSESKPNEIVFTGDKTEDHDKMNIDLEIGKNQSVENFISTIEEEKNEDKRLKYSKIEKIN